MKKKTFTYLFISVLGLAILGGAIIYRSAFADVHSDCLASSDSPDMVDTPVCSACANSLGYHASWNTVWISPPDNSNTNIISASANDSSVTVTLRNRQYTCDHPLVGGNWTRSTAVYYAWIGQAGDATSGNAISWISTPPSSIPLVEPNAAFSWATGGNTSLSVDIAGFKAYVEAGNPGTSYSDTEYRADISINICNSNEGGRYIHGIHTRPNGTVWACEGWPSTIIINFDGTPDPDTGGTTVYYESQSGVDVKGGVDMSNLPSGTLVDGNYIQTDIDGDKNIEFSVDSSTDSYTVTFKHRIDYRPNGFTMGTKDQWTTSGSAGDEKAGDGIKDVPDNDHMFTAYTVTNSGNGSTPASGKTPVTHSTTDKDTGSGYEMSYDYTFSNLQPGVPQTACSTISYKDKNHTVKYKKHIVTHAQGAQTAGGYDQDGNEKEDGPYDADGNYHPAQDAADEDSHLDWYWSSSSDAEDSKVCVTIIRPKKPGGNPENPNIGGGSAANIMFAGEDTSLKWNIWAEGVASHRLQERQAIGFFVKAGTSYGSAIHTGNDHTSPEPCGHYNSYAQECKKFSEGNATWSDETVSDTSFKDKLLQVKVPNEVGGKYCNSAGYKFQHYYAIDDTWIADNRSGKTYWYIFNASCRTIAKKPTTAIWNGGIFTSGGFNTSIANRHNSIQFGELATTDNRTIFGSWSEFLAVASKSADSLASGSVFYNGASSSNWYPLTIANSTSSPGYSGIIQNQTLLTRLNTFLKNQASDLTSGIINGWTNVGDTIIYKHSGDVEINGNITISSGPYGSIYDIPQVIIFVDGDVKIASNVSQIDAWIITPNGTIDTCAGYQPAGGNNGYGTQTDPSGKKGTDICANQLVFNGPVIAKNLKLNRSFGADPDVQTGVGTLGMSSAKSAAAEVFNFRADTYLWAYAQSSRYDSSFTESYSRELAPRYQRQKVLPEK